MLVCLVYELCIKFMGGDREIVKGVLRAQGSG